MNNILHHANSSLLSLTPNEIEKLKKFTSSMSMMNVENTKSFISSSSTTRAPSSTDI